MKLSFSIIITLLVFNLGCSSSNEEVQQNVEYPVSFEKIPLKEMIDISKISTATIRNIYGTVDLSEEQLERFKSSLSTLLLQGGIIKPGTISFVVTIDGKVYSGYSTTGSETICFNNLPVDRTDYKNFVEFCFTSSEKINLNNYKAD